MKSHRLTPIALFITWVGLLVAYWPSGCSQSIADAGVASPAVSSNPETLQPVSPSRSVHSAAPIFLPHPAFALAQAAEDGKQVTIADIAERATPSVVNVASRRMIKSPRQDEMFRFFFGPQGGEPAEREARGLGSGVVYSKDGLILTNNHVIEGADEITVTTGDGVDHEAEIVGTDDKSDVAVLRLKGSVKGLVPITLGDSAQLRVGDVVLAIGNPFGLSQTVTMGIVSAKGRSETGIDVRYADFIQTDAAINPGNSGGALVNMQGELVGINTAIFSRTGGYQGIGFAIPSNMARQISQSLAEHGRVVRGFLGVIPQTIDADVAAGLGLPTADGVVVTNVEPGSPAGKAGMQQGDVILTVDGKKTDSEAQLRNVIAEAGANKKVELAILRGGKPLTVSVTLGELEAGKPKVTPPGTPRSETPDGLSLEELTPSLRQRLALPPSVKQGIVVTGVAPGSVSARAGLQPGDVIMEARKQPIKTVLDFRNAYDRAGKGPVPLLVYRRDGVPRYLILKR